LSQYNGGFNKVSPLLTGYDGSPLTNKIRRGLRSLEKISSLGFPIVIASNSPVFHVRRVLNRLGLAKLPIAAIITPERK
jgi:FMN phosphatase YigB (HAD superfamily)